MRIESQHLSALRVFIASLTIGLVFLGFLVMPRAHAAPEAGERLVTIHDRGVDRGLITKKDTLREVFAEADVSLDKNDLVEPGLDEKLVTNNYQVNVYRARPVIIIDGAIKQLVMSAHQTPKQIAKHAGIILRDEDDATISLTSNMVSDGASIQMTIDRATPIQLVLYGKKETVYTQTNTVKEFLSEKGIILGKKDTLSASTDTSITSNMKIEIWHNGKQTVTNDEAVAFSTKQIQDANREVGYKKVTTPGVDGKKSVTYEIVMKNGKEASRRIIQSVVVKKAEQQVEIVGSKAPPVTGPAEIISLINKYAGVHGLDANKVARIAKCESGFNPSASNGRYLGLFQHDSSAWAGRANTYGAPGASIYDARAQVIVTTAMMANVGYGPWECQ